MTAFRTLLVAAALAGVMASGAGACPKNSTTVSSPLCSFTAPTTLEKVVMVKDALSYESDLLNAKSGHRISVVDIVIEPGAGPTYWIFPRNNHNRIYRFTGAVEEISRVVLFTSRPTNDIGVDGVAGVVGVPKSRIEFSAPYGYSSFRRYETCGWSDESARSKTCLASQYFAPLSKLTPEELNPHFAARIKKWLLDFIPEPGYMPGPKPHGIRSPVALTIFEHSATPRGPIIVTKDLALRAKQKSTISAESLRLGPPHNIMFTPHDIGNASFNIADVVSNGPIIRSSVPHPWQQIAALYDSGKIHASGSERYKAVYDNWMRAMTGPFYDRIGPEGKAPIPVDYVVSEQIGLPGDLHYGLTLLVDKGVPTPSISAAKSSWNGAFICFYFVDGREDPNGCVERFSKHDKSESTRMFAQHVKDGVMWKFLSTQEKPDAVTASCAELKVPSDATVIGLATQFGKENGRVFDGRQGLIDVVVKSPGKTFLALHSSRSRMWAIDVAKGSEVVGVALYGEGKHVVVTGLPESVPVVDMMKGTPKCPNLDAWHAVHNGGPSAALWNQYFLRASGKEIDRFIGRRQLARWGSYPENGATFVIE